MLLWNFTLKSGRLLFVWFYAASSVVVLLWTALSVLWKNNKPIKERFKEQVSSPEIQRRIFGILRAFRPNIGFKKSLIASYKNGGTIITTHYHDVQEVLDRDDVFEVVYEPRMRKITGGQNFFLGMQNTPTYMRDVSNMRLAFRREDIPNIVLPMVNKIANEIVDSQNHHIDVVQDLTLVIPTRIVQKYFGISSPTEKELVEWSSTMFWYLFLDLTADEELEKKALNAAENCRNYIDNLIADHKNPPASDSILSRCLSMKKANLPGMEDIDIRNNLLGLLIGAIPTISMAAVHALDQLLRRPSVLRRAQKAAMSDDETFPRYIFEALRFNPVNLFIYRYANCDAVIAKNTLREYKIRKNYMVLASNLSAMFDINEIASPNRFRIDRPWRDYMLWGHGLHTCFGAYLNEAVIPAILKPLLKQTNLCRAKGNSGHINRQKTPFPINMMAEF